METKELIRHYIQLSQHIIPERDLKKAQLELNGMNLLMRINELYDKYAKPVNIKPMQPVYLTDPEDMQEIGEAFSNLDWEAERKNK